MNKAWSQKALRFFLILGTFVVLALPFLYSPAPQAESPPGLPLISEPARKLVIVSPHWEGIRREFSRAFALWSEKNLGYRTALEWLDLGGTSDAVRYVRSEFKRLPEGIGVDIFFGGGVDPYLQFKKDGLLQAARISPSVLDKIPETYAGVELYDRDRRWFGACLSGFGIIYNKKVLEFLRLPEPVEWSDLALPRYFSWVGSGDPRSSGSVHMVYEIILQAYGWEKGWSVITRMGGNIRNFSRSGSDVPKDTALGEIAFGLAIDVYAWRQVAQAGPGRIGFVLPEKLTVISPDSMAVLKGAPNADLAERFIEFTLSEEGQKLLVLRKGIPSGPRDYELSRMSVIPGFGLRFGRDSAVPFDPFAWRGGFIYDAAKGSQRWSLLNDLIGAFIIDNHQELSAAWDRIRKSGLSDSLIPELTKPPFPEAEGLRLAREKWREPEERSRIRGKWTAEARERYRRIIDYVGARG